MKYKRTSIKRVVAFVIVIVLSINIIAFAGNGNSTSNQIPTLGNSQNIILGESETVPPKDGVDETPNLPGIGDEFEEPSLGLSQQNLSLVMPTGTNTNPQTYVFPSHAGYIVRATMTVSAEQYLGQMPKPDIEDEDILNHLLTFYADNAVLAVDPTDFTMNFQMASTWSWGTKYAQLDYYQIEVYKPNQDFTRWDKAKPNEEHKLAKNQEHFGLKLNVDDILTDLEPGPYAIVVGYRISPPTPAGGGTLIYVMTLVVNPEFINPTIKLIGAKSGNKDPESIELGMNAFLLDNQPLTDIEKHWTITNKGSTEILFDGETQDEINVALNLLDVGTYTINYTGSVLSGRGYDLEGVATQDFEITTPPKFNVSVKVDLADGFERNSKYYDPATALFTENYSGIKPSNLEYVLDIINKQTGTTKNISTANSLPSDFSLKSYLSSQGILSGTHSLKLSVKGAGVLLASAESEFTLTEAPKIDLHNKTLNPVAETVTLEPFFTDSQPQKYKWRIFNSAGTVKESTGEFIPTKEFASLPSVQDKWTEYQVELTEIQATGFQKTSVPQTFYVRLPNPTLNSDLSVTPPKLAMTLDSEMTALADSAQHWVISKKGSTNKTAGGGTEVPEHIFDFLDDGDYTIVFTQVFVPYSTLNDDNGKGTVSLDFSIRKAPVIDVSKNIEFGTHEIKSKMDIPWERIDGTSALDATDGKVLIADITAGAKPITSIKLTASEMVCVTDPSVTLDNTLFWGTKDKLANTIDFDELRGYELLTSGRLKPGENFKLYATDDTAESSGFYMRTNSGHLSKMTQGDYSGKIEWKFELGP